MSANVETMFYVREKPWHGLGTLVMEAPASADALVWAGLDWKVIQKEVRTEDGAWIAGYKANVRSTDGSVLGIVSDRYKVVQNEDAFRFTDELLGEGVTYETLWPQGLDAGPDAPAVHHRRRRDRTLPGNHEFSRWQQWGEGGHDSHPGGLPEHP